VYKLLITWKRNPRIPEEEAEANYLGRHTELGRAVFNGDTPGFRAYVQNKVVGGWVHDFNTEERRFVEPDFDRFIEVYFDDEESLNAAFTSPEMTEAFGDHAGFMDTEIEASIRVYQVEEVIASEHGFVRGAAVPGSEG
jgi:hypothetical protein